MYSKITKAIAVSVEPIYLEDQSEPEESHFVWAYRVKIQNNGRDIVQLKTRHWRIIDAFGRQTEIRGAGVVGEQPILKPGESFEYTSGTPLPTPSGMMTGSYEMETTDGQSFPVDVPAFSLDSPYEAHILH